MTRLLALFRCVLCVALLALALPSRADGIELTQLTLQKADDGLELSFNTRFDLPGVVENAVNNLVPVYFTVDVNVYRSRWYWRDAIVAKASRTWRLSWQPLTRQYRVSTGGGLTQSFASLGEALATMRSVGGWRIGDARDVEADGKNYLEFSYKLDTSQLPKPMQIGLTEPHGWALSVDRTVPLNPDLSLRTAP